VSPSLLTDVRWTPCGGREAQLLPKDIDWFGLYDCFPVCFVRALEACGVAPRGGGGAWVQAMHERTSTAYEPADFPINTHGGLLAFGAPWEVPAMYNIIEAPCAARTRDSCLEFAAVGLSEAGVAHNPSSAAWAALGCC